MFIFMSALFEESLEIISNAELDLFRNLVLYSHLISAMSCSLMVPWEELFLHTMMLCISLNLLRPHFNQTESAWSID